MHDTGSDWFSFFYMAEYIQELSSDNNKKRLAVIFNFIFYYTCTYDVLSPNTSLSCLLQWSKVKGQKVKGPKVKGPKVKGQKVKGPKVKGQKDTRWSTKHHTEN